MDFLSALSVWPVAKLSDEFTPPADAGGSDNCMPPADQGLSLFKFPNGAKSFVVNSMSPELVRQPCQTFLYYVIFDFGTN